MQVGKFCYIYFKAEGVVVGTVVEKFDKYWKAIVVRENKDKSYTFKYTNGESVTKKLGNPITTVNGKKAPEIFTEDEYFGGAFNIESARYNFAEDFRQEWLDARYQRDNAHDTFGANIYYIYGAIEGGFDWYWEARKEGEVSIMRGNQNDIIHKFTYTNDGNPVYVLDSSVQISITQYNQPRQFFSAAEYFNGTFNIYNNDKYSFSPKFEAAYEKAQYEYLKEAYEKAKEEYDEAVAIEEFAKISGGSGKLRSKEEYDEAVATVALLKEAYEKAKEAYDKAAAAAALAKMSGGSVKLRF